MLEFRDIELNDKPLADKHLRYSDYMGCEYSFGNNYTWKDIYNLKVCDTKDFYLLENIYGFIFPAGEIDIKYLIEELKKYTYKKNKPLCFSSMNREKMELLVSLYGDSVMIESNRDLYDYIYTFEALSTLSGKKLHSKRNHLNRFRENNWSYEPVGSKNIDECVAMSQKWCEINKCGKDSDKAAEICAVNLGLKHYFDLGFKGGLLRVDGEVQAFTFGEHLNSSAFVVHAEKAFTEFQGTYPAINYEFVNHECSGYKYINREEDMGEPNLRKAKLSYKPEIFVEKYKVTFK
ncbi:MAG: phosphatidylglycerol lysyltransferase domain-containing protein [Eubacterium sp.]|jgi:hypothetical protein|nr:phosphatidylglycerol lysyltransferase domain-containing protein [Eubacterium sp.]